MRGKLKNLYFRLFGDPWALNRNLRILYIKPILLGIKNKKVLDIGCGDGSFTKYLLGRGNQVFAIDTVNYNLSGKYPEITFTQEDGRILSFKDNTFDFVFCSDVLEHVEGYPKIVKEASRVTKKGGNCLFSTVSGLWDSPIKTRKFVFGLPKFPRKLILGKFNISDKKLHKNFLGHLNYDITPEKLGYMFEKNSLKVIGIRKYCSTFGSILMEIYFSINLKARYFTFPFLNALLPLDSIIKAGQSWQFYLLGEKIR